MNYCILHYDLKYYGLFITLQCLLTLNKLNIIYFGFLHCTSIPVPYYCRMEDMVHVEVHRNWKQLKRISMRGKIGRDGFVLTSMATCQSLLSFP